MTNLCSPSTMCGPFCSVPAVPTMIVVVPAAIMSRTSAQVSSSSMTVSGGFPAGAVAGAVVGRCAERMGASGRTRNSARRDFFMAQDYKEKKRAGAFQPSALSPELRAKRASSLSGEVHQVVVAALVDPQPDVVAAFQRLDL